MCKTPLAAALAALAVACSSSTPVTPGNFTVATAPSSIVLLAGEEAYLLVTFTPTADFASPVSLAVSGLPPGTSVEPVTVPAGETSAVLVVHGGSSLASAATATVTATSGTLSHTAPFQLSVGAAPAGGTNPVLSHIVALDVAGGQPTGYSNPTGVAVNTATGVVYMVNDQGGGLAVYDPGANSLGVLPIPSAEHVAVDAKTGTVYAVGGTANLLVIKGSSVSQVVVGGALQGVAVDSQNGQVFVAENLYRTVHQVDGATLRVLPASWSFGSSVEGAIAVDERRHTVYASTHGGIGIINQANGDAWSVSISRINSTLSQSPVDLSVDARTGQAYILGSDGFTGGDGWIHLLDDSYLPDSTSETATNAPSSVALDPGTNKLYVADSRNQSVNVLDLNTGTFLKQVFITPSGGQDDGPIGVAVDPATHQVFATMRHYNGIPALAVIDGR